jgi:hypothetical protein
MAIERYRDIRHGDGKFGEQFLEIFPDSRKVQSQTARPGLRMKGMQVQGSMYGVTSIDQQLSRQRRSKSLPCRAEHPIRRDEQHDFRILAAFMILDAKTLWAR